MIRDPAAQGVCERCGAWLPVRPDAAEFVTYTRPRYPRECPHRSPTDSEIWSPFTVDNFYCEECRIDEPIEEWRYRFSCLECGWPKEQRDRRDPLVLFPADLREIMEPGQVAHAETWRLPLTLVTRVNYAAARHAYAASESELADLPSLLDHGGRRVARWGSVYDDDGTDPHKVRLSLARLRHARRDGEEARAAWLLCERAVLAVNLLLLSGPLLARRVGPEGQPGPLPVAPVLGGGGLSIEGRYRAWMAVHQGYPWLFDPSERWHDRMRRRFAGLPDPAIPVADVARPLWPLCQFIEVADDLELFISRHRRSRCDDRVNAGIAARIAVFRALCASGELDRNLPYAPGVREPGYVPDCQRGSETQFI
jgi:hypothetical protein